MKILFVCLSNICRSPYCEYMFKRMVKNNEFLLDKIEDVKSSAVLNLSFSIHPKTIKALISEGFDEKEISSHKPTFVWTHLKMFDQADIIIGMSKINKFLLPIRYWSKFTTLSEVATGKYKKIPDPFFRRSDTSYSKIMQEIKSYLEIYLENLIKKAKEADRI